MSKEFIDNEIDSAHQLIKEGEFEQAVAQLKLIKIRVHDTVIRDKISTFEKEHDDTLKKRLEEIEKSSKHHFDKRNDGYEQISSYAKSYLSFYDKLRKENDVF